MMLQIQQKTVSKRNLMFNQAAHFVIILTLFQLVAVSGDSNWLQECDVCHCHWNSGKKTADCKNKSIAQIPTKMSSELQVIDLSNNIIPEIRKDELYDANLQNLHKLYMKNCTLQELNRDSLKGLSLLIELDLSNNFIRILHAGTLSGLVKLRNLLMNNNEIEILENNLFRDLVFLHRIEFKHNRIKRIESNAFVNLPQLTIIYLDENRLTTLKRETFENMPKLKDLSLAQNPWNCTCELQPFREFTLSRKLYTPPTDCHEPPHLNGKLWSDIPMEDFACRPKIIHPGYGYLNRYPNTYNTGTIGVGTKLEAASENVTISCRVRGSPKPDIFWIYNKRPINLNDQRLQIRNTIEPSRRDVYVTLISDLTIYGIRTSDKGTYTCVAENRGGKDEVDFQLAVNTELLEKGVVDETGSNLLLIICIAVVTLILILTIVVLVLCCYCRRRIRNYSKDATISENGLITTKVDKSQNGSILEGSVIMEMQKSLLTEVNPVEKPPRRTDIEATDTDDGHEIKKTLLDETPFGSHDEETNSVTLSDTTPRSRQTFVDDGYGTNLPPDLLAFPARVPHSPSLQSSMSNIQDNRFYGKSPLSSPVYQHIPTANSPVIYGTTTATGTPVGFRTLQHPKTRNLILATNSRNNSPFVPAPIIYPPVIMKQGYMTIPRKPRVPSWTPSSVSTALAEYQPTSPNPSSVGTPTSPENSEPVYDNLGRRTTAGGNSASNVNKLANNQPVRYTMKDRPLPATPTVSINSTATTIAVAPALSSVEPTNSSNSSMINNGMHQHQHQHHSSSNSTKIYEPIQELSNQTMTSDTEPLYGTAKSKQCVTIVPSISFNNHNNINLNKNNNCNNVINNNSNNLNGSTGTITKIPPRPPPKPKKKISVTSNGQGSTSQLFEEEGEDGTEV